MERLLSVLDGEVKCTVISVGRSGIFYAAALKTLKQNFGNPQLVAFLKLKSVLDLPQISSDNYTGLKSFHQQLKWLITWLESIDNISSADSVENISKAVIRLPKNLRFQIYKDFKENTFSNYHIKLRDFERWPGKKMDKFFNPISAIIVHQEKHIRVYQRGSERENKSKT